MPATKQMIKRWLFLLSGIIALIGYLGPWIDHKAAGLIITGLDLGEYVKFLPAIRQGAMTLWREGFYLPLLAISVAFSLYAFRREMQYNWLLRIILLLVALICAFNLLPPAWTPDRLMTAEFRLQTLSIGICVGLVLFSPFLALLPQRLSTVFALLPLPFALWLPVQYFWRILPDNQVLYNQPLQAGWGIYVMVVGLMGLGGAILWNLMGEE